MVRVPEMKEVGWSSTGFTSRFFSLCYLTSEIMSIPEGVVKHVSTQLGPSPSLLAQQRNYPSIRSATFEAVRAYLGVRAFQETDEDLLRAYLMEKVTHTGNFAALSQAAMDWLVSEGILRPHGETTLERLIYQARNQDEAPVTFMPKRWEQVVCKDEKVDKHAWEFVLLHEARTALRAGDLTVEGSQRYAAWDTDLYQSDVWATRRDARLTSTSRLPFRKCRDRYCSCAGRRGCLPYPTFTVRGKLVTSDSYMVRRIFSSERH